MNDARDSVPDAKRSSLRATIAAIERELALTPPPAPESLAV